MNSMFVLIPGAWHGGWAWEPVARRLRAAGHCARTLTMPGMNGGDDPRGRRLTDAVDHIVAEVRALDRDDLVLVAHSWGGYPMTGAAHRLAGGVSMLIYLNAFVPEPATCSFDEFTPEVADRSRAAIAFSADGAWHPSLDVVRNALMPGEPLQTQRLLTELLVPQPSGYSLDKLDVPRVSSFGIPAAYILSAEDQGLGRPQAGRDFAARLGVEPTMVPGSHEAMLTHPDEVANAILQARFR